MKAYHADVPWSFTWKPSKEARKLGIPHKLYSDGLGSSVDSLYDKPHRFGIYYVPPVGQSHTVTYYAGSVEV
jgi:hypothetical protein